MLSKLKSYGWLILSGLVATLGFLLKISGLQRKRLKTENESLKGRVQRNVEIATRDNELELQARSRRAEARNEIKETGVSEAFRDPNKLFDD